MSNKVLVTTDGAVTTITLNSPEKLNAVDSELLDAAAEAIENPPAGSRVIVVRGAGRAFSSGADLTIAASLSADEGALTIDGANRMVGAMVNSPLPVVSVVQGPCAGVGVPMALAADLVIASSNAFFQVPFSRIGLMPDGGSTAILAASVGRAVAMRMALLGERVTADQALSMGLIAKVVPLEELDAAVDEIASKLATGPAAALQKTKHAINQATLDATLEPAFALERVGQLSLLAAPDFAEGATAFLEQRAAQFSDLPA